MAGAGARPGSAACSAIEGLVLVVDPTALANEVEPARSRITAADAPPLHP